MRTRRTTWFVSGKSLLVATVAGTILLMSPAQAWAHVTVTGTDDARGGSDALVIFRVPTESDTASTVELAVALPTATPLASVDVQALPGWTSTVTTVKLAKPIQTDDGTITEAVSQIDWKADSATTAIKPGDFQQFPILVGQLPDTPTLTFPAIQTYSDHSVVRWTEVPAPGNTVEPDHPAPVLTLAAEAGDAGKATASSASGQVTVTKAKDAASKSSVRTAIGIAIVGVLLGLAGLSLAAASRRHRPSARRQTASHTDQARE